MQPGFMMFCGSSACLVERISEYRSIIAFRNVLIHGYAQVDDKLVWDVVQTRLPALRQQISGLLQPD